MNSLRQRITHWARLAALALLVAACGGGVETGGTGPTGAAYVEGPITGFGSVIVGGVRFDDALAVVEDAYGNGSSREALRLGMRVEVESGPIADDGSGGRFATATRVRFASDLLGPVTAVDANGLLIGVLGQAVRVTLATVVDGVPGGAGALQVGDIVEVHGFIDPGLLLDRYVATRIERRSSAPASYRVRGLVRDLAGTTLRVGAQRFELAAVGLPAGLAEGQVVRLTVGTVQGPTGWPVSAVTVESRRLLDREEAEVEGLVTAFTSVTRFFVNGIEVDASGARFEPGSAGVVLGARVKVRGAAAAGRVVATRVELRDDDDAFNDGIDLRDAVADLDRVARSFRIRGIAVDYDGTTQFEKGSAGELDNGDRVRVRGKLSADRTRVRAERIEFLDN
jgi:hypothetical protein